MDCDARVLRVHPSPERYGMLILTIAQRRSIAPTLFAPMLSEPTTNLERRILAMRTTTRKLARTTMYGGGVIAVALLAFASSLQSAGTSFKRPNVVDDRCAAVARLSAPAIQPETIPIKPSDAKPGEERSTQTGAGAESPRVAINAGAALSGDALPRQASKARHWCASTPMRRVRRFRARRSC